jgi:hypothetical protein
MSNYQYTYVLKIENYEQLSIELQTIESKIGKIRVLNL